uniref:Guanylate cyclase domain-containing protein n=1 Tax=Ditylenchus dipsaci TaxID=166011 RepID=A0A915DQL0_9BILA
MSGEMNNQEEPDEVVRMLAHDGGGHMANVLVGILLLNRRGRTPPVQGESLCSKGHQPGGGTHNLPRQGTPLVSVRYVNCIVHLHAIVHILVSALPTFLFAYVVSVHILNLFGHSAHILQHGPFYGTYGFNGHQYSGCAIDLHRDSSALYLSLLIGVCYSCLFELLSGGTRSEEVFVVKSGTKLALHACIHLLGVHLFILTQVRQRKTFLKVGQSLLARKDLELETQFKDHMIQSVMPKKVASELLKETTGRSSAAESTAGIVGAGGLIGGPTSDVQRHSNSMPSVRKFRPFTMNLMTDVSILFADIAGFTKMSSNNRLMSW